MNKMGEVVPIESLAFLNIRNHFDTQLVTQWFFIEYVQLENLRSYNKICIGLGSTKEFKVNSDHLVMI